MNTKAVGEITEAKIFSALVQTYPAVLIPFGENQRYDFVYEDFDGAFIRVQCKTGRYENGAISFKTHSISTNGGSYVKTRNYKGVIDYFGVSCEGRQEVYLVPVDDVPSTIGFLRVEHPKNNQLTNVRWAKDYLLVI